MTYSQLAARLTARRPDPVVDIAAFRLPGNQRPWQGSGLHVRRGQHYSLLADGRIQWSSRRPSLHAGPGFHLWARVHPGGKVVNVTRTSGSFVADADGEIQLGIYLGMWRDEFGELDTPAAAYARLDGELTGCVIVWRDTATVGLAAVLEQDSSPALRVEHERLQAAVTSPAGWAYLREIGMTDVFTDCRGEYGSQICVAADDDQGIIRRPVDFPLTPGTRLAWRWRLRQRPGDTPEDTPYTHDYISLGAEFDNGRDLTWIWSSTLQPGHWFACPIRAWSARETHYVVRNDPVPSGWHREERAVHADVAASMGPPPARIVAIWLIVVATFQHGRALAEFGEITLTDGGQRETVL